MNQAKCPICGDVMGRYVAYVCMECAAERAEPAPSAAPNTPSPAIALTELRKVLESWMSADEVAEMWSHILRAQQQA